MGEDSEKIAELEQRIEYLSVQVERLIDLHNPFNQGLLPFPPETVALFNDYAGEGTIDANQVKNMIKTFIPGGDASVHDLVEAWEAGQNRIRPNNDEHH